ncbi:hypothetical protein [Mucilaginibacter sp.]|uniref:hypothetical protein n=1 Tax=Mucilaginibacter sp. TaxID=1882438 RepID=UPI002603669C|nr:hypothetical protein [Mucilaginibacter sp.]MDB4922654.1 hypothetical protein [Mucilaginibacter sp.]
MKTSLLFVCLIIHVTARGQNRVEKTTSLLTWLIKKDHITYLNAKSNAGTFYDTTALTKHAMVDESFKEIPGGCIKDMLSADEVETFKKAPKMLMQTDWRKKYSQLKVKFMKNWSPYSTKTIYSFSEALYLNKNETRVLIGENFWCGMTCGRMDLLLCEFINGSWQLLGRVIIENE